jgi:3-methyladenine DNA glycosylase AlkD
MKNNLTAEAVKKSLLAYADKEKAAFFPYFFKTGKGQYGEGDKFIGVTVPDQRKVAKEFLWLSLEEIEKLLNSPIHEHRLTALIVLVYQYQKGDEKLKEKIFKFYLAHTSRINNWDLVDCSCRDIVGEHLQQKNRKILYKLAKSKSLWERRIAMVSTWAFIRKNDLNDTFAIAEILLDDNHDLMHKAVGWMLREAGKRNENALHGFLKKHIHCMPRTALRYSIEKFSLSVRKMYLSI